MAFGTENYYHRNYQAKHKEISNEIKQVCNRDSDFYKVFWNETEKNINLNSFIVNSKTTGKRNTYFNLINTELNFLNFKQLKEEPASYKLCERRYRHCRPNTYFIFV